MGNLKHTIAGAMAVVMISSLAVTQAEDLKRNYNISSLLSSATSNIIVHEDENTLDSIDVLSEEEAQRELNEQYTEEELNAIIEEKSHAKEAYVILTSGVLSVRENPSEQSALIDSLEKNSTIEIIESTEDWYKIRYADSRTGYALKSQITENKEEAELAAKYYDNYRYAKVKSEGGTVRVREGASTSTSILGELENGASVLVYGTEGNFTKICFGEYYSDGFMISSALELQDSWLPKTELEAKKVEGAKKKAQKEAAEKAAREAAAKKKAQQSKSSRNIAPTGAASSSKGQAIVNTAKKYLGVRYVYGGSTPSGFDCSGLVQYVFKKNGISVSRTSAAQSRQGKTVSRSELQPGDLLFFARNGKVHHVGIYAGNGQMIHAPHTGDVVRYTSINTSYRNKEFYCAKRFY